MPIRLLATLVFVVLISDSVWAQPSAIATELAAEVAAARASLQEHPKFQKYYEHLAANPDTLAVNGPKLAAMLAAEAKTSVAIKDHAPSLLATWQEVMRLAAAGNDYKAAFPAIDLLQAHPSGLLSAASARATKARLLAAVAEANAAKPVPGEREALLELVRALLKDSLAVNDVEALPALLAADAKLSWSTTESANSIQLLLPLAQQAIDANRAPAAKLLFDHLEGLVLKTAAGKARKDFAEGIAAAREQLTIVSEAQRAQQTLSTKPLDPAANLAYGKYLLAAGQVKESLTYLALGDDAEWKVLGAETLEAKAAADKVALADRWSASTKDSAGGKQIARLLYAEALADKAFVGIPRAATEEKLKSLGPAPAITKPSLIALGNKPLPVNEWVDVLPLIDIDQDLARGYWSKGPQQSLLVARTTSPKLRLPLVLAKSSYDLLVEFRLFEGPSDVYLMLPVGDRMTWLLVDSWTNNDRCFFHSIPNSPSVNRNLLHENQAFRYEINVRLKGDQAQVVFSLNGGKIIEYNGPVSAINSPDDNPLETFAQPALAPGGARVQYTKVAVRAIDGPAAIGREVPLIKPIPPDVLALKATRLTSLKPLGSRARDNYVSVSSQPPGMQHWQHPILGSELCRDFIFAHAPSSVTYAIPPKTKYFTAIAFCVQNRHVKFVVKADGQELFAVEKKPVAPVVVEIPDGAKVLELICDDLGNSDYDHSSWCFPAFRQ